jgi:protein-S-isoprenylcysteine O-methyltransferase Ste14
LRILRKLPVFVAAVLLILFARPTLAGGIVGGTLIAFGQAIRVWAAGHLQKNEVLTVTGPYAYVKNPLYIGTILIAAGFCIVADNVYILALLMFLFCFHYIPYKKAVEGDRLRRQFGEHYDAYDRAVPEYIPRTTPYTAEKLGWSLRLFIENSEEGILMLNAVGVTLVLLKPIWEPYLW